MRVSYGRGRRNSKKEITKSFRIYVSKYTYDQMKEYSKQRGRPMSRLCLIALHNELDQLEPFAFKTKWPDIKIMEDEYAHEAELIFQYILNYSRYGISLEMLMLMRHDVGIENRERMFYGYMELLKDGLIEEFYPILDGEDFQYPKDYRHARVVNNRKDKSYE